MGCGGSQNTSPSKIDPELGLIFDDEEIRIKIDDLYIFGINENDES